jgi:hypothetical protein
MIETEIDTVTLHLPYLAAVPVGHRVELRYIEQKKEGLFKSRTVAHEQPIVIDLDTGIEYGIDSLYEDRDGYRREIEPYPDEPGPGFALTRTLRGRVTRCRVLTEIFTDMIFDNRIITKLVIEIQP